MLEQVAVQAVAVLDGAQIQAVLEHQAKVTMVDKGLTMDRLV